jgi:hypothetical protein
MSLLEIVLGFVLTTMIGFKVVENGLQAIPKSLHGDTFTKRRNKMSKRRNRPSSGKQAMSANLRKIARQNQLYGFRMALDGIATTWGALIQNIRCEADLTDEQVQKIIRIGDRYWEMVGQFKNEDMTPEEFADYITAKSEQVEKELRERWN